MAKTNGISWIDGLDHKESIQWADGLAAGLAAVSVLAAVAVLLNKVPKTAGQHGFLMGSFTSFVAIATVAGMVTAGNHDHGTGGGARPWRRQPQRRPRATTTPRHSHATEDGAEEADHVEPVPYDPAQPIDLSGFEGVTPEQQARAENLIAVTLDGLPQWSDPEYALANGFFSIGDGLTGTEHFLNLEYITDDVDLDPDRPESLVWDVDRATGKRTLSAAMFMAKPGVTLDNVPDIGGKLTQWHVHDNLCFNGEGRVAGLTNAEGECAGGLRKGAEVPMIHVWIRPHECGPFAALEGIGGGTIPEGEERLCDHAHGSCPARALG